MTGSDAFHVVTVGWSAALIDRLFDQVASRSGIQFSHIAVTAPARDEMIRRRGAADVYRLRDDMRAAVPEADPALLASLEAPGVPTIHNMIMGDRVVSGLPYDDAAGYATLITRRLEHLYRELQPSLVIGGFDSVHGGLALAVARKLGIPWVTWFFTSLPRGLSGFCAGMTPATGMVVHPLPPDDLRRLAETTLQEFEQKSVRVPLYESANTAAQIAARLPRHARRLSDLIRAVVTRRFDRFGDPTPWQLCRQYLRKRLQLFRLPTHWMITEPPRRPFGFYGLHMQPESSVDVWAPFHSNQFSVIEAIARSMPPDHDLVIKMHRSDADNYSRRQLDRLRRLPRVILASPFAQSRDFIERAAIVFSIHGTMGLEAALLGKAVLMFGESPFVVFLRSRACRRLPGSPRRSGISCLGRPRRGRRSCGP